MVKVADFILAKWRTSHPPRGETRLHFSFPQRERKIDVATSVCTGSSHMLPAYGDLFFESHHYAKIRNGKSHSGFLGGVVIMDTSDGGNLTNAPMLQNLHPKVPGCTLAHFLHPVPIKCTPRNDNDPWGTS